MKHRLPPYHYELPNGTISTTFDDICSAFMAGAKATWSTDMKIAHVKVFNTEGQYVPSWEYCDDCNYAQHICHGCGDYQKHEDSGACPSCRDDYEESK